MALSQVVGTKRDGTITIKDNGANTMVVTFDVGDFTFTEPKADRVVIRTRGAITGLRKGDDAVGSCGFSVHFSEFTNAAATTLMDFCYQRNAASAYASTGGTGFEQFLVTVEYKCDKTALGDASGAQAILDKVLLTCDFSEGDSSTLSVTGEVYGSITYTGIT